MDNYFYKNDTAKRHAPRVPDRVEVRGHKLTVTAVKGDTLFFERGYIFAKINICNLLPSLGDCK